MAFSSGTFSLVAGNPVVTGTTISSTWANNTLSDIATNGLTLCILKNGTQTVTANIPFAGYFATNVGIRAIDGTVGAPGLSFNNETDCGFYVAGTNNIGLSLNGAKTVDFSTTGVAITGVMSVTKATAGNAFTWTNAAASNKTGYLYSDNQFISVGNNSASGSGEAIVFDATNNVVQVNTNGGLAGYFSPVGFTAGTTATRGTTQPTNSISMSNGTAPVGAATNLCTFYVTAGECRVMDAAGNATLLSPHDGDRNWIHHCVKGDGKEILIRMEQMAKFLNDKFGKEFFEALGVPFLEERQLALVDEEVVEEVGRLFVDGDGKESVAVSRVTKVIKKWGAQ